MASEPALCWVEFQRSKVGVLKPDGHAAKCLWEGETQSTYRGSPRRLGQFQRHGFKTELNKKAFSCLPDCSFMAGVSG